MAASGVVPGDARVVYFGGLDRAVDSAALNAFVARAGRVEAVDARRGYAFVSYASTEEADAAVATLNGGDLGGRAVRVEKSKPATERPAKERRAPRAAAPAPATSEEGPAAVYSDRVIVRGLPRDADAEVLQKVFSSVGTIVKARISRGLGRIRFADADAADRAVSLAPITLGERVMVVEKERVRRRRTTKKAAAAPAPAPAPARAAAGGAGAAARTTKPPRRVRVDGLAAEVTADVLRAFFEIAGPVASVKVVEGRGHGFVTMTDAANVAKATALSGSDLKGSIVTVAIDAGRTKKEAKPAAAGESGAGGKRTPAEADTTDYTGVVWAGGFNAATEADVRPLFAPFGAINSIEVGGEGRWAYIRYAAEGSVAAAVSALNGQQPAIAARPLRVEQAAGRRKAAGATKRRRNTRRAPRRAAAPAAESS